MKKVYLEETDIQKILEIVPKLKEFQNRDSSIEFDSNFDFHVVYKEQDSFLTPEIEVTPEQKEQLGNLLNEKLTRYKILHF